MNKKKVALIIGIALLIIGLIAIDYAQGTIDAYQNRYTWTRPYSGFEQRIILTKYFGIGSVVFGIVEVLTVYIPNLIKSALKQQDE